MVRVFDSRDLITLVDVSTVEPVDRRPSADAPVEEVSGYAPGS